MDTGARTVMRVGARAVVAMLAVAIATPGQATTAIAAAPGENGRIAFTRDGAIWSIEPDGSDERQLAVPTGDDSDHGPAWSPGGTMIAYVHSTGGFEADLWIMNADGSGQRQRTSGAAGDWSPSWSPDAAAIAFHSDRNARERTLTGELYADVWSISPDYPTRIARLTREEPTRRHAYGPAWSPDREWIAATSYGESGPNGLGVFSWRQPAEGVTLVAEHDGGAYGPDWAPDGEIVVYHVFDGCCGGDLWTVAPGGSPEPMITGPTSDLDASYSPDGTRIVFQRDGVLHVADADGGNIQSLGVEGSEPAWQPLPAEAFADARFTIFATEIEWAHDDGITSGCAPERFCAGPSVTRAESARFVAGALDLPATAEDAFVDDEGSPHEWAIDRVAAANISGGCGMDRFCPSAALTRGEVAAWLVRALELPASTEDAFVDDELNPHEWAINRLAAAGLASGCGPERFCPWAEVSRGELVAFLYRAVAD